MKKIIKSFIFIFSLLCLAEALLANCLVFDRTEYINRRSRLMDNISNGVAIFLGATTTASDRPFRQGHDFFYLTGIDIPNAYLVIDGLRRQSLLFFTISEKEAESEGIPLELVRDPQACTGVDQVLPEDQFGSFLSRLAQPGRVFYTPFRPEEIGPENSLEKLNILQKTMILNPWDGRLTRELQFVRILRERFPQIEVRDCTHMVWNMRKIKSPAELEIIRRAAQIGVEAHREVMRSTRPGTPEKSLEAVFQFVCRLRGAIDMAYTPILMSGKNHAFGHYHKYDRILQEGDIVILDAGPALADYHVDISSTFPASGRFMPRQKELYEVALSIREICLSNYQPGISFSQVGAAVDRMIKERHLEKYLKDFRGIIRFGGYNHLVGMATHDVAGTVSGPDEVLVPGLVFACDIQLFRLEEQIGIRIEDTIAITESGYENLSRGVPRTVAEIEALMKSKGLLQLYEGR